MGGAVERGARAWALAALGALCGAGAPALAQVRAGVSAPGLSARVLRLRSGTVETARLSDLRKGGGRAADGRMVVQLDGPITRERRGALEGAGLRLGEYLPDHAYFAEGDGAAVARAAGLGFVAWVGAVRPEWKVDPSIGVREYATPARQALRGAGRAQVVVVLFEGADEREVVNAIGAAGGRAFGVGVMGRKLLLDAEIRPADAPAIAALAGVQYVEDAPEGQERFDSLRWVVQSNVTNFTPVWNRGIHGEGQVAGVIDGTVNIEHCAFADTAPVGPTHRKIVAQRAPQSYDSHGTHVAGIIAGDQGTYGAYDPNDGIAFAARLSLSSNADLFSSPTALYDIFAAQHADGARVHSNSFGDNSTGAYTSWCAQIDQFCWDSEDDLVCFAVSNGAHVKSPENALNALAVGASQDAPFQGSFCFGGTGPTDDGRRKPDVFAPGCNIVSANSSTSCSYVAQSGTSMACPAAAGASVLARQYFTDGYYPTGVKTPANALVPSGALLRAVMVNSAVDMPGILGYPSNQEGWGRILMDNALYFPGDQRKLLVQDVRNGAGLGTTESTTYAVTVLSGSMPLTVTMAFTAPPGTINAADPVSNNLDLEVLAPDGALYRGNVFSAGQSFAGQSPDPRNNVEQVMRLAPAAGTYQITVRGTQVNVGSQGFALVVSGDIDLCLPPVVPDPPQGQTVAVGQPVTFSGLAYGSGTLAYQWKKDLVDLPGETGSDLTILEVHLVDQGSYSVTVTGSCGSVTTLGADLVVPCVADFDHNGFVNGDDYDAFVAVFEAGDAAADVDNNTFVNGDDYDLFVDVFVSGC